MPIKFALIAVAVALGATSADAADMAGRSRIGAVFAQPAAEAYVAREAVPDVVQVGPVRTSPKVPGYYGDRGDFFYQNYYGTPRAVIFERLPYGCVWQGFC
jgi:hypothetical protein